MSSTYADLKNKVAIITGAGQGIGKAVAEAIALSGAIIIVNDVNIVQAKAVCQKIINQGKKQRMHLEALPIKVDVSNYQQVVRMVETIYEKYGRIDILINNAGILRRRSSVEEIDDVEWDLVMKINAKSFFNCSKAVIKIMKGQRSGKIVNVSSSAGRSTSELGGAHYTASKAAVLGLSRHLARELAPYGINVNAICPSLIDTPMVRKSTSRKELASQVKTIPMGRLGTPQEVANLVLFLVSDASSYINGATVDIGGASLLI